MALPLSGAISIGDINTEFGRSATAQTSMSQLYRGGGIVTSNNTDVPTSGQISLSQFYGASNLFSFTISSDQTNANLRTLAVNAGWDQSLPVQATINSGIYCSSNATGTPALTVNGSFPNGVSLINNGFIVARGGNGGNGGNGKSGSADSTSAGKPGSAGGTALSVSVALTVTNNGAIYGGGGGGGGGNGRAATSNNQNGGGGGGGGRSSVASNSSGGSPGGPTSGDGNVGQSGQQGTFSAAGAGGASGGSGAGAGGAGGSHGAAGTTSGGAGGAGGASISGNSNITWLAFGTRLGAIT
jgi:hypothetical protein